MNDNQSNQTNILEAVIASLDKHAGEIFAVAIDEWVRRKTVSKQADVHHDDQPASANDVPAPESDPLSLTAAEKSTGSTLAIQAGTLLRRKVKGHRPNVVTVTHVNSDGSLSLDKQVRWPAGTNCKQRIPAELVTGFLELYRPFVRRQKGVDNV